jgi:hypothetical protein
MKSFIRISLVSLICAAFNSSFSQKINYQELEKWIEINEYNNPSKTLDTLQFLYKNIDGLPIESKFFILESNANFALHELRDFKLCMKYMQQLKKEVYGQSDYKFKIKYHNSLGEIYYNDGINIEKSYEQFKIALQIVNANQTDYLADLIYSNFAISLMSESKFIEARDLKIKALKIAKQKNDYWLQSIITNNLGVVYIYLNKKDSANFYFQESYAKAKLTKEKIDDVQRAIFLGLFNNDQNQPAKALEYFQFAQKNINHLKNYNEKKQLFSGMSRSYSMLGNYKEAFELKKLEINYIDSAEQYSLEKESFIYDYEIHIKALENETQIQIVKNQKSRLQVIISLLSIIILLITILFLFVRNRRNRLLNKIQLEKEKIEKEKISLEKDLAERENTSKAIFLLEKDNLIHTITSRLQETIPQLEEENQPLISRIIQELKGSINNKRWGEFELRFNKIHPKFYERLETDFPSLSPNEKKLCAFLSMNMTSKDISNITNQSSHSINIARGRLRKKLKIDHIDIDILQFLSKYTIS